MVEELGGKEDERRGGGRDGEGGEVARRDGIELLRLEFELCVKGAGGNTTVG